MNNPQRKNMIDDLSLEIPRLLPPDLRQVFLTNYPDGKYGQLFEANYLVCWHEFARRMKAGGFFKLHQRNAAVRPAPGTGRPPPSLANVRRAAVLLIEACDQIAAEGRVH